jgi:hypothetical protein
VTWYLPYGHSFSFTEQPVTCDKKTFACASDFVCASYLSEIGRHFLPPLENFAVCLVVEHCSGEQERWQSCMWWYCNHINNVQYVNNSFILLVTGELDHFGKCSYKRMKYKITKCLWKYREEWNAIVVDCHLSFKYMIQAKWMGFHSRLGWGCATHTAGTGGSVPWDKVVAITVICYGSFSSSQDFRAVLSSDVSRRKNKFQH